MLTKGITLRKSILFANVSAFLALGFLGLSCGDSNPVAPKTAIAITSPIAAQKVCAGDTIIVTWTQSVSTPKLSYNYNYGAGWQQFAASTSIGNNSAKVILPTTSYSDSFQIKVEDNSGTFDAGTSAPFSIKYIVVTSPTAGQSLTKGSTVTVTWKDTPSKLSSLRLLLSTDGGKTFGDMLKGSISDVSTTSFSWVIGSETGVGAPFSFPSTQCILKIEDYTTLQFFDKTGIFSVQ